MSGNSTQLSEIAHPLVRLYEIELYLNICALAGCTSSEEKEKLGMIGCTDFCERILIFITQTKGNKLE